MADPYTADELAAGERLFAAAWGFVLGAPELEFLPAADRPEIAFAGRSNVGKSSLINALVNQHGLARTSNTPGRTQELNFFVPPDRAFYLVDMPGYGFAKAPKGRVDAWTRVVKDYLRGRVVLKRVFLLIDARHGIKPVDAGIMQLLNEAAVTFQVVLTKADKIKPYQLAGVLERTSEVLRRQPAAYPSIVVTSAEKKGGIDQLRAEVVRVVAG